MLGAFARPSPAAASGRAAMSARHSPQFIDEATVRRLLSVAECIASVEEALAGYRYLYMLLRC
eukprot:COSAG02_NODE_6150_length_3766_cov_2.756477_4_plen_63_part_00